MTEPTCRTCKWWRNHYAPVEYGKAELGRCHIRAPDSGGFPVARSDDFCGEHTPKQKDKKDE